MNRVCPNCGTKMVKNHSSINADIEVDECYACGGKFLDNGELLKIEKNLQLKKTEVPLQCVRSIKLQVWNWQKLMNVIQKQLQIELSDKKSSINF